MASSIDSFKYSALRDSALSRASKFLAARPKILWYVDTLALSARYLQWLKASKFGDTSRLCENRTVLWEREVVPLVESNCTVLEFGVANGLATKWWAGKNLPMRVWHGFDTFTGLPTDWSRAGVSVMSAGVFNQGVAQESDGLPSVSASYPIEWHVGLINETLSSFVFKRTGQLLVFIDVDLLEPTQDVLNWLTGKLNPGDLIYFDEAFDPWNEGLALREFLEVNKNIKAVAHTGSALLIEVTSND